MFSMKHRNRSARAVVLIMLLVVSTAFTVVQTSTALAESVTSLDAQSATKAASSIQIADYTTTYTGKPIAYAGQVKRTGSTGAIIYKYFTNAKCTKAIAATKVVKPRTYYVVATLTADANYEAANSAPAKLVVTKAASSITLSDYSTPYTGKAVAYGGQVKKTGSTGAVSYKYFTDAECKKAIAATKVVKPGTYYVVGILAADANYKSTWSAPAKLTITSATKGESTIQLSDYTTPYTGKAVTYGGNVKKTGSTGAVTYKYFTDAECKKAIAATKVVKPGTYYVVGILAADANFKAARSEPAKLTITSATKGESTIQLSDYSAPYTGQAIGYDGEVKRTGSTGAVYYKYYTDAECTKAISAKKVIKPRTYYVVATLAAAADYKAANSAPAKLIVTKGESSIEISNYTTAYTGKPVAYAGQIKKTGSTSAVVYSYFSDAACTEEVAASEVVNAGKYYVKASLLPDSNYKAATSNVAVMTIDASLSPEVKPGGTTTYSSWDDVPANNFKKEVIGLQYNGQYIYGIAYIPILGMQKYPLVICSHGINGNHTTCREFAAKLASHGIAAYCFDFRGAHDAQSDGNWKDTTISTEVEDLQAVIAAAKQWSFVDSSKIILYGICQGGTVSAITAARNVRDVQGLILLYPSFMAHDYARMRWNSLDDVPDVVSTSWITVGKPYIADVWDYDCYDEIGNYTKPVLLMHGDKDTKVPIAYSNRAAEVYRDVDYFVIEGADHGFAGQHRVEADQHILDYLIKLKIY